MKQSKVVEYYNRQVELMSLQVSEAEAHYLDSVRVKFRVQIHNRCAQECKRLAEIEKTRYIEYFKVYLKYIDILNKYMDVKRCEQCHAESR